MNKKVLFLLDDKYVNYHVNTLIYDAESILKKSSLHDTLSFKYAAMIFKNAGFKIEFKTPFSFLIDNSLPNYDFIVVNTHRINEGKLVKGDNSLKFKNKVEELLNAKTNFIFIHHFYHLFPNSYLDELLGVEIYSKNKNKFRKDNFKAKIVTPNHELLKNVPRILNSNKFGRDEFTYLKKDDSDFKVLISKSTGNQNNFILFGYKNFAKTNYSFLIDIHDVGRNDYHKKLFEILVGNCIDYCNAKS